MCCVGCLSRLTCVTPANPHTTEWQRVKGCEEDKPALLQEASASWAVSPLLFDFPFSSVIGPGKVLEPWTTPVWGQGSCVHYKSFKTRFTATMSYDSDIVVRKVSRTYNVYRGTSPTTQNRLEVRPCYSPFFILFNHHHFFQLRQKQRFTAIDLQHVLSDCFHLDMPLTVSAMSTHLYSHLFLCFFCYSIILCIDEVKWRIKVLI